MGANEREQIALIFGRRSSLRSVSPYIAIFATNITHYALS
ncbi:hypothetical protein HMPREF1556_00956 [Porphyromonas sp. oral taxon 278 str. W7784]|nr:hypothetical protein HMPREF1556_00956 [Porphyromonas sp. oral taxon 278 str. W7784]